MDPIRNPYSPGAGTPPPELAGRDHILENAQIALDRVLAGRPAKSQILLGLRGVGTTVLLGRALRPEEVREVRGIAHRMAAILLLESPLDDAHTGVKGAGEIGTSTVR